MLPYIRESAMKAIPLTRPALEAVIRRLVLRTVNIKQISGRAVGLVAEDGTITGVKRRAVDGQEDTIPATLVVGKSLFRPKSGVFLQLIGPDCTGVALGGFHWLQDLFGSKSPAAKQLVSLKETFNNKYHIVSCFFKVPDAVIEEMDKAGIPGIKENVFEYIFLPDLNTDTRSLVLWSLEKNIRASAV